MNEKEQPHVIVWNSFRGILPKCGKFLLDTLPDWIVFGYAVAGAFGFGYLVTELVRV